MRHTILITGGAGFIGINAADYFLRKRWQVILFDNLSRKGVSENLKWLRSKWAKKFTFIKGDVVYDRTSLDSLVKKSDAVLHLAAQVAVTTSVENPFHDFLSNVQGTLNILEAVRSSSNQPSLIYASTNKVYGNMDRARVILTDSGYRYSKFKAGIAEHHLLDFHSPYGCSKGAADQYVRDYARIYGLKTTVFRQSCIYGPHQFGVEDQGWVAWFVICAILGRPISIYGDGHQVRDVLHVEDLCRLYHSAFGRPDIAAGEIYNIGGGVKQAFSLIDTLKGLEKILKKEIPYSFSDWRPGDQKVYISDIGKIKSRLGWEPHIRFMGGGLGTLVRWAKSQEDLLRKLNLIIPTQLAGRLPCKEEFEKPLVSQ